jgi:Spy/CpxP family protein refolding chaperone
MKRNQWAALLLAALLFVCGAAIGALADHLYEGRSVAAKNAEDFRHRYIDEMQSKLKLTPAQLDQLEVILDDTKAKVKTVRDAYHPAMLKIKEEQISRVKSILTPQQIPAYEQLVADHERHAREQEERERQQDQRRAAARQSGVGR